MILGQRRLLPTAIMVFVCAFAIGFGRVLTQTPAAAKPHPGEGLRDAARSGEDAGFSITLTSPRQPYLLGNQPIVIEPSTPPRDAIAQVDIFVDGRLVFTDRQPPYRADYDFGETIHRHMVVAAAVTREGRRAKVSFISRSAELADGSSRPIELLPTVVRDVAGHPVDNLSVSDFTLLENGVRQPIVHFDPQPAPASIAVVVEAADADDTVRKSLLRGAGSFAQPLPGYQALALVDGWGASGTGPVEFSYDRQSFVKALETATAADAPKKARPLAETLSAAVEGLKARADQRMLLLLIKGQPPRPPAFGDAGFVGPPIPPALLAEAVEAARIKAEKERKKRAEEVKKVPETTLAEAIEALKRARITLYVVVSGEGRDEEPYGMLRKAAEVSGGSFMTSSAPPEIDGRCLELAEELLHQYLIGFLPEGPERTVWRTIEIKVRRADVEVRARKGYSTG